MTPLASACPVAGSISGIATEWYAPNFCIPASRARRPSHPRRTRNAIARSPRRSGLTLSLVANDSVIDSLSRVLAHLPRPAILACHQLTGFRVAKNLLGLHVPANF